MSSSDSDSEYIRRKRHKEKTGKDKKDRSPSAKKRKEKKSKERETSRDRKRRHRSKNRNRSRSRSRGRSDSSSYSKNKNNKNKKREDKSRRGYKDEIEDLKDKEIQRKQNMEQKRKQEDEDKKKDKKRQEEINQKKDDISPAEKLKLKKQSRYAKAIAVALLESVDEKKNEVLKNDEIEDFLQDQDKNKNKDFMLIDELENFEEAPVVEEKVIDEPIINFTFLNKKMPQLPKEFLTKPTNKKETKIMKESQNEEEDPLDAYMKTLEKEAVIQDYEIVQLINRQHLQRQYDEIAEKYDTVQMMDQKQIKDVTKESTEKEADFNKKLVVSFEDIVNFKEEHTNEETEEDFHQAFVQTLKGTNVPDFDPILGYTYTTDDRKENIIYQEDVNEFRKEADFVDTEEAWIKAKKNGEKGKELKLVNHAEIAYEDFRKDFYRESREIANMTEEEVIKFRKEKGEIKIRGKNISKPIANWHQCGFYDKILAVLEKKGFTNPFPIQSQGIPCIMSGRDVIGIAETGSGKTLAYVLPMLRHILDQNRLKEGEGPISLIFAPTRELATQIYSVIKSFTKIMNLRVSCVYGGSGIGPQVSELRRGAEIVVCTPGRMIEVLCMNNGKVTNLQRVTFVVIDEADRMFDMGFEPQLSRILANIRPDRQTVMFSATFPKQIENLAKKILNRPVEIVVGQRGQSCTNVIQYVEVVDDNQKLMRLLQLLGDYSDIFYEEGEKRIPIGIIIFVDQQSEADELYKEIFQRGYLPLLIHGGQDQEDRNFAIYDFKTGVRNILISTSVCARGLDVKHCGLVINFKCPSHMEDYVHRVGRAGRKGEAYTFISKDEAHLADDILRVLEVSSQIIPQDLVDLVKYYKDKKDSGEADKFRISGYWGRGYEFSQKERDSVVNNKKELGKGYLMLGSDDEDADVKGKSDKTESKDKKEAKDKSEVKENLMALALVENEKRLTEKRKAVMKDKTAQQIALDVGANAVKNAIIAGKTEEEALQIAQEAIERVLTDYKPSVSAEKGAEQAAKIIEEWVEKENIKNNIFTCELDINEYPANARSKVIRKDYLSTINELSGCTVTLRGLFVEPNKKPPLGQKRLHLYIQGNSKQDVLKAFKEIKQVLDETALMYYTTGSQMGQPGRYQV